VGPICHPGFSGKKNRSRPLPASDGQGVTEEIAVQWHAAPPRFPAMRIAVLSDTHDHYPPTLPGRLRGADEIWHLGDVCDPATLVEFEQLGPPLRVVMGNCDSQAVWPSALELEREGVRFYLTHIPPPVAPPGFAAVVHGHTHVPRDEVLGGVRWLNPGCVTRPRGTPAGFAWLTVERGKLTNWELVRI
jgi:predicted phosphodiesterase